MGHIANSLIERLEALSDNQLAEVESFITRLRLSEHMHGAAFSKLSQLAMHTVWDNAEDDIYNQL